MTIIKSELPNKSILQMDKKYFDYIDSFQGEFIDKNEIIGSTEIGKLFFTCGPKWIEKLLLMRNKLVGVFGLKTSKTITNRHLLVANLKCEKGEQLGLFKVFDKTSNELLLGEDDKHLNFRISLFIDNPTKDNIKKNLTISTAVTFNNWFGRLYFIIVRPFHKLIVPAMLNGILVNIESRN